LLEIGEILFERPVYALLKAISLDICVY